jgi:hypothetical protein
LHLVTRQLESCPFSFEFESELVLHITAAAQPATMKVSVVTGTLLWCWLGSWHTTQKNASVWSTGFLLNLKFAMQIFGRTRAGNLAISLSNILERSSQLVNLSSSQSMHAFAFFFSVSEQNQQPKREAMKKSQQFTRYKFGSEPRDSVA